MKENFLLITGGTGGHVIPAQNFANYLSNKNIKCTIITDTRGYKYINNFKAKIYVVSSSNLNGKIIFKLFGIFQIFFGLIQSLAFISYLKPSHVISFGSYASFPPMISCVLLKSIYKINLYIHEQNSIIGRTNKFFLNYIDKLFLNFDIKSLINIKFKEKSSKKKQYIHTLNGSGLAVGRTLASVIENFQDSSGNVEIPDVLRPYMNNLKFIKKNNND